MNFTTILKEQLREDKFSKFSLLQFEQLREKHRYKFIARSDIEQAGQGLFSYDEFKRHEITCVYEGDRITKQELNVREQNEKPTSHAFDIGNGIIVDGYGYSEGGAIANHSCNSNARLAIIKLDGPEHAPVGVLRALRKINPGEEVTCPYNYDLELIEIWEQCSSGAEKCSGWIGA